MPQFEGAPVNNKPTSTANRLISLVPGILLRIFVAGISALLERAEWHLFAHPYVEGARQCRRPPDRRGDAVTDAAARDQCRTRALV